MKKAKETSQAMTQLEVESLLNALGHGRPAAESQLGKYTVERILGCSGQAIVLLATDSELQRQVVLKLYPPGDNCEHSQRMLDEGRALARISSPFIAHCYGTETVENDVFLAIEYVEGEPLSQILSRDPISVEDALRITRQITSGLVAVHSQGLLHGDLKPGNVIVATDGTAKLIDFGLTRSLSSENPITRVGTAAYMPPEVACEESSVVDERADVFGIGAILYHMLTGQAPFASESAIKSIQLAQEGKVVSSTITKSGSEQVASIALQCLSRDPRDRPATARHVLELLDHASVTRIKVARRSAPKKILLTIAIACTAIALLSFWQSTGPVMQPATLHHTPIVADKTLDKDALPANDTTTNVDYNRGRSWAVTSTTWKQLIAAKAGQFETVYQLESAHLAGSRHAGDTLYFEQRLALAAECIPDYERAIAHQVRAAKINARHKGLAKYQTIVQQRLEELESRKANADQRDQIVAARRDFWVLSTRDAIAERSGEILHEYAVHAEDVRKSHEQLFGLETVATLDCLTIQRRWLYRFLSHKQALEVAQSAHEISSRLLGPTSHESILNLATVSLHATALQSPDHEALATQVLEVSLEKLGPNHAITLNAFRELSSIQISKGQCKAAQKTLSAALQIAETVRPEDLSLLWILMSRTHLRQNDAKQAFAAAKRAEQLLRREESPARPHDWLLVYEQLSLCSAHLTESENAAQYSKRAVRIGTELYAHQPRPHTGILLRAIQRATLTDDWPTRQLYAKKLEKLIAGPGASSLKPTRVADARLQIQEAFPDPCDYRLDVTSQQSDSQSSEYRQRHQ